MRIAYLGQMADVSHENGIAKKIRTQIVHWLGAGHTVRYFSLAPTARVWPGFAPVGTEIVTRGPAPLRILRSHALARRIQTWRPDAVYFRYAYHSAGLPALFRAIPTAAEINSDDLAEYPLTLSGPKLLYHRFTRDRVLRAVDGFVPVTHELGSRFAAFGKPTEVIANGTALADFPPAPLPPPGPPRLIFIGTAGTPWHGLERVGELSLLLPNVTIDIVGCTIADWHRITAGSPPPQTLAFYGALPRERYEPLLHAATAALGTLALYKNGMREACPLKVREYLACGIPVIAAYQDTDVPDGADYFLHLPNDATRLARHLDRVRAWLDSWRNRRVPRDQIAHLDTTVKEARRLRFLQQLVAASTRFAPG